MVTKDQVFKARELYLRLEVIRNYVLYPMANKSAEVTFRTLGSPKLVLSEEATAAMLKVEYDNIVRELTYLGVEPSL